MKPNVFLTLYNARVKHIDNLNKETILKSLRDLAKPISYISYDNKLKIVQKTIESCRNSIFPTAEIHRAFIVNLISAYTNIEMDNNGFDVFSENKLIDVLLQLFESEYNICRVLLQMCLDDIGGDWQYG